MRSRRSSSRSAGTSPKTASSFPSWPSTSTPASSRHQPEIVSRGFVPLNEAQDLVESAREVILKTIEKSNPEEVGDWGVIKEKIRTALRKHFNEETGKRPMILPVVLEV